MKVEQAELNVFVLTFTKEEQEFFENECKVYKVSISEMIYTLFGMLFVGGYSLLTGKDK